MKYNLSEKKLFINRDRREKEEGLAIYYQTDLYETITGHFWPEYNELEYLTIKLNDRLTIIAAYINKDGQLNEKDLDELLGLDDNVVIIGDLNA